MHALLCRSWKNRVKGRDWYDLAWYISHNTRLNIKHLEERMRQSGHYTIQPPLTLEYIIEALFEKIDKLDIDSVRKEVSVFIKDPHSLDIWSKDFFKAAAEKVVVI
jgi:hypothetical protein